jgi:outer membrane receptor for ferrienterochelin and colicins
VLGSRRKNYGTGLYDGTVFNDPGNFTVDAHQYLDLQYDRALSGESSIFGRVYLSRYDYWGEAVYDLPPRVTNKDETDGEWWGGEVKYTTRIGKRHRLTFGGEYIDYTQANQRNYDGDPNFGCITAGAPTVGPCQDSKQAFKTWGLYVQDEISLSEKLILSLGVRYDDLYQGRTSTNPRLGVIYNPTAATAIKFLYGTAFRAPSAYERYYSVLGFKQNPDLKAEEIETAELAVEHGFNKNVRGIASVYQYRLDNLIGLVEDPADGLKAFRNLEPIDAKGLELELDAKWPRLEGRVSYTYQDVQNKATGATLINSPKHLGKLNIIVPLLPNKLFAGFETQYVAQRNNARGNAVPGYTLANLTLTSRNWIKGLELSASVYNLFDKRYGDPASADDDPALLSIPQDARTYRAKLIYRF